MAMIETEVKRRKEGPSSATFPAKAFAARSSESGLSPLTIQRRAPRAEDVHIRSCIAVSAIRICIRCAMNENTGMPTVYPCVPGHEIIGRVVAVGSAVRKLKEGDLAAVGCMVDSCRRCPPCLAGDEQYCENVLVWTYNGLDKFLGGVTYGGYSESIVVDQAFVLRVPNGLDPAGAAPLLCAGITTYAPLRHWNVGKGQKVGIVALVDWAIWRSHSRRHSVHMSCCSRHRRVRSRRPPGRRRSGRVDRRRRDAKARQ